MRNIIRYGVAIISVCLLLLTYDRLTTPETTERMVDMAETQTEALGKPMPPRTFVYDGCSLWFDSLLWHDLRATCLEHDIAYWMGGTPAERKAADVALREEIAHTGLLGPVFGPVAYGGVRLFGDSFVTHLFDVNWGYGWND